MTISATPLCCALCHEQPAAHTHRHGKLTMAVCTRCNDLLRRADAARELELQRYESGRSTYRTAQASWWPRRRW